MAKSNKQILDQAVADELGLNLSTKTLTLKHVLAMNNTGKAFHFLFRDKEDELWLDGVPIVREVSGRKIHPEYFVISEEANERLYKRLHLTWYFSDDKTLYPVQPGKLNKLDEFFLFKVINNPTYKPMVILQMDKFHLRKKPLKNQRPLLTWEQIKGKR